MNIREIAKAAGVSPSTVSKVINRHDSGITAETRERVLRVIKDMNYVPYARVAAQSAHLIGVILQAESAGGRLLDGISQQARAEGYSPLVFVCHSAEEEMRALRALCSHRVNGIIWQRAERSLPLAEMPEEARELPLVTVDAAAAGSDANLYFDMTACAAYLTEELLRRSHLHVLCLADADTPAGRAFITGYRQAMYRNALRAEETLSLGAGEMGNARLFHSTAAVCADIGLAQQLIQRLESMRIAVPQRFSVASLLREGEDRYAVSGLLLRETTLGRSAAARVIGQIEQRALEQEALVTFELTGEDTLGEANVLRGLRVLVVGALNMDTLMRLPASEDGSGSVAVLSRTVMPGGKALNQAIACKKLGAEVSLIGCLGQDYEGAVLHSYLQNNGISTAGVSMDQTAATGYACVTIGADGESRVLIDRGANKRLTTRDIDAQAQLFGSAGFCLLQTELSEELALHCARLARQSGAKVILKPCNQPVLTDELLCCTDYLIPNHHDLDSICPEPGTLEEKAQRLLERGARCVVVTMGSRGCYLTDGVIRRHFPAARVHVVDTTGACDAFAAALAVFLMRGEGLETAIEYATCAAGLSTEQQGVPPAVPDLAAVLQFYQNNWQGKTALA